MVCAPLRTTCSVVPTPLTSYNLSNHHHDQEANISLGEDHRLLDGRAEALKATLMTLDIELPGHIIMKMASRYDGMMPMDRFLRGTLNSLSSL